MPIERCSKIESAVAAGFVWVSHLSLMQIMPHHPLGPQAWQVGAGLGAAAGRS